MSFKDEYAIVGIGETEVGHVREHSKRELAAEAARLAIEDAGIPREKIEATIRTERAAGTGPRPDYIDEFPRILKLPIKTHFKVGRGGEMAAIAVTAASQLIDLGITDYVLVSYACKDWTRTHPEDHRKVAASNVPPHLVSSGDYSRPFGELAAAHLHAFLASRHMHEYGTTSEDFGRIAVAQREWACRNPNAYMYGRPITLEDHQESRYVVEPYHLYDLCLQSDGGASFLVTSSDNVDEARTDPVYVKGVGFGEQVREDWWTKENYLRLPVSTAKETAFETAGIELDDVDFAQLYDCFTAEVLFQLEDYGWAEKGAAGEFLREEGIGPGGAIPINTGGGLLSSHHFGNMTGIVEAVRQLRGDAGERQVDGADTGIVTGHGGEMVVPGMASTHTTLVLGN